MGLTCSVVKETLNWPHTAFCRKHFRCHNSHYHLIQAWDGSFSKSVLPLWATLLMWARRGNLWSRVAVWVWWWECTQLCASGQGFVCQRKNLCDSWFKCRSAWIFEYWYVRSVCEPFLCFLSGMLKIVGCKPSEQKNIWILTRLLSWSKQLSKCCVSWCILGILVITRFGDSSLWCTTYPRTYKHVSSPNVNNYQIFLSSGFMYFPPLCNI